MAVKIIKKGKIPVREFKETCDKCGTVFSFNENDCKIEYDYSTGKDKYGISCPVCNRFIYRY